ncbi:MAG: hypothetical protein AB7P20_06235 [Rhizobiaceae bacterium]
MAVKAVTVREDEAEPKERRKGEADGAFQRLARTFSRRFDVRRSFRGRAAIASRYTPIDPEAHAVGTGYLSDTLDMLHRLDGSPDSEHGGTFNAISYLQSPHL